MAEPLGRVGRFTLLATLGEGGMGIVYRARDERLGRMVALKVLRTRLGMGPAAEATARMIREARAAAALNHPNVVALHDAGEDDGVQWLALELVEGEPLRRLIPGDATLAVRLEWLRQIAEALAAAHAIGIVHRDVKPDNVLVRDGRWIKVLDFGLARSAQEVVLGDEEGATRNDAPDLATITGDGRLVGTPAYMAPEQIRCLRLDPRCDQFAWGVVAHEVLSGASPWTSDVGTLGILASILTDPPLPLVVDGLAPEARAVIARTLEKDREARFPSMQDLVRALDEAAPPPPGGRSAPPPADRRSAPPLTPAEVASMAPTELVPVSVPSPAPARIDASAPPASAAAPGAPPPTPRRTMVIVAAVVAALGAATLGAWRATGGSDAPTPPQPSASAARADPSKRTLLDEPPPTTSTHAEALAAYRKGRLLQRECDWSRAREHFERAIALAPEMGEAHFQLAVDRFQTNQTGVDEGVRAAYRRAVDERSRMSARDRAFLEAHEPLFSRDPPDWTVAMSRMLELVRALPDDAEIRLRVAWLGVVRGQPGVDVRAHVVAATELDPDYADAWQARIGVEATEGRFEEAIAAAQECHRLAPSSKECASTAAFTYAFVGRCEEAESEARSTGASQVDLLQGPLLLGLRRSPESVLAAFERSWVAHPERHPMLEQRDRWSIAMAGGDLVAGRDHALRLLDAARTSKTNREAWIWSGLVALAVASRESGRLEADAPLLRRELEAHREWEADAPLIWNHTLVVWDHLRRSGLATDAEVAAARDRVRARYATRLEALPTLGWAHIECAGIHGEAEARAAVARRPAETKPGELFSEATARAHVGHALALAGDVDAALPWLRAGATSCMAWGAPHPYVDAHLWLGDALAARGDQDEACRAYGFVVERWGTAKPRSVTAELARRKLRERGCPAAPPPRRP